jgi:putative transposase
MQSEDEQRTRDGHTRNKAAHIAVGVDMAGVKHFLGIWVQQNEGHITMTAASTSNGHPLFSRFVRIACEGGHVSKEL